MAEKRSRDSGAAGSWNLDEWKYYEQAGQTLILSGWCLFRGKKPDCSLESEGRVLSGLSLTRQERPDVAALYPETPDALESGFAIAVPRIREYCGRGGSLEVWLRLGEERIRIWSRTTEDLRRELDECLIRWHLDASALTCRTMLTVRGWAFSQDGTPLQPCLEDQKGKELPARLVRSRRPDVVRAWEDETKTLQAETQGALPYPDASREIGFMLTMDVGEVRGKNVILCLKGNDQSRSCRIDLKELKKKAAQAAKQGPTDYDAWARRHRPSGRLLRQQRHTAVSGTPLVSIVVPLYRTPLPFLKELIASCRAQTWRSWELCLADAGEDSDLGEHIRRWFPFEKRIRYKKLSGNLGISENTNEAIRMSGGSLILFADHDDLFAPDALFEIVSAFAADPGAEAVYTDEDKVSMDAGRLFDPNFKPDYNLFRLRENNYICHIFAVKRELLEKTGLLRKEYDGAQDYDLILRCCEKAERILHIPKALYHWRSHMASTAADPTSKEYAYEAGRRALQAHYSRMGILAQVEMGSRPGWYISRVRIPGTPLVSLIIPTKDHPAELKTCLDSVLSLTSWKHLQILILDNGTTDPEALAFLDALREKNGEKEGVSIQVLAWDRPFNFSALNNYGASAAKGEYLLFLNNDTRVLTGDWIQELLMICCQDGVGAVGAKLLYPDGTIQHAGVVLGLGGIAGHVYCQGDGEEAGYMGRLISVAEVSAVTAACMMVRRTSFEQAGGFDEDLAVAFNDIDLCLKLRQQGEKVVFTPRACLVHYESKSRGLEDTPEKQLRFASESARFRGKWHDILENGDPYYNPNLSLTEGDCRLGT